MTYFAIIEKIDITENSLDLIHFKKALYLLKESNYDESNKLLKKLIEKESSLKIIAQEILNKLDVS